VKCLELRMGKRVISILLSLLIVLFPFHVQASQQDPDDSLKIDGRLLYIGKGERTPFEGILFDITAAAKLKIDKQFMLLKFDLEKDFLRKKLNAEHTLALSKLQIKYDTLQEKHKTLLGIKDKEIERLTEIVTKKRDYTIYWTAGGIIVGIALTIAVVYAVRPQE
jgi:hypothetical protein